MNARAVLAVDNWSARLRPTATVCVALVVGLLIGVLSSPAFPEAQRVFALGGVALLSGGLGILAWYRPHIAIMVLVIVLPFNDLVFARAWQLGAGSTVLQLGRFWKEGVIALVVARVLSRGMGKIDALDRAVIAFLGLAALYVVLPIGPPLYVRLHGARADVMFLILLLAFRRIDQGHELYSRLEVMVMCIGVVLSLIAFWNVLSPNGFQSWIWNTGLVEYRLRTPDAAPTAVLIYGRTGSTTSLYAGSLFTSAGGLAYYLLMPIALVLGRIVTARARWIHVVAGTVCLVALLLTQSRSAIAALPLMVLLAFLAGSQKSLLAIVAVGAFVALIPLASSLHLGDRLKSSFDREEVSTANHIRALEQSRDRILSHPFGTGLGTAGALSQRFESAGGITNESWYLQVGTEAGVIGMLLFIVVMLLALRALWIRSRTKDVWAIPVLCALGATAAGALVLHTLGDHATTWTLFGLVGLAIGVRDSTSQSDSLAEGAV